MTNPVAISPEEKAALDDNLQQAQKRIAELEGQVTYHKEIADAREFDFHQAEKRISSLEEALKPFAELYDPAIFKSVPENAVEHHFTEAELRMADLRRAHEALEASE